LDLGLSSLALASSKQKLILLTNPKNKKTIKNLISFDNNQLIKEQSVIVIIFYNLFG